VREVVHSGLTLQQELEEQEVTSLEDQRVKKLRIEQLTGRFELVEPILTANIEEFS
jgi:hypothetical protein